jgi:hypothetical protein
VSGAEPSISVRKTVEVPILWTDALRIAGTTVLPAG